MAVDRILERVLDQTVEAQAPQIHIRFHGRSFDVPTADLDIGVRNTDAEIRTAVANHLEVPQVKLEAFAVDRNEATGDLTLRPEAVFG